MKLTGRWRRFWGESLESRLVMMGAPILTEFVASNTQGLTDDDGETSDWFEIYNPTGEIQSLDGWFATDNPDHLKQWEFPNVSLDPGEYLTVFASGKDRSSRSQPLHTNFKLASGGESLILVRPDGQTIASKFSPYPTQREDISYGLSQPIETLLAEGAPFRYRIPSTADSTLGSSWMLPSFDPSPWNSGKGGVGFGVIEPGFDVRQIVATSGVDSRIETVTRALTLVDGTFDPTKYFVSDDVRGSYPYIDFGGDDGSFSATTTPFPVPNTTTQFVVETRATVRIPAGDWTIAIGSDEGGLLQLSGISFSAEGNESGGVAGDDELRYEGRREFGWTSGQLSVGPGGLTTNLRAVMFERTTDEVFEIAIRPGHSGSQVNRADGWTILQSGTLGWVVTRPSTLVTTDVRSAMVGTNTSLWARIPFEVADPSQLDGLTLHLQANDGYVAYLNGIEVARSNAPASLPWNASAVQPVDILEGVQGRSISLAGHLNRLVAGTNILALVGLSHSVTDDNFLLNASLSSSGSEVTDRYFPSPTPNAPNGEGVLGFVSNIESSHDGGFYSQSFSLELASQTPGAVIRYTTNGTTPTQSNGATYVSPIAIDKTTTVRSIAFLNGADPSRVETNTYIFLNDVLKQSTVPPSTFPRTSVNGQVFNYGMDPEIVNSPTWGPQMIAGMTAIPSLSIVTDPDNLFSATRGIYVNAFNRGASWERPASVELLDPTTGTEFQVNAGLRMRGGFSRTDENPKHSFRLFFRDSYGDAKLDFPMFQGEGASEFDNLDLRTAQNYSWAFGGDGRNTLQREVFSRDTQRDMGNPYTRSRYYHLYLNGQYWGVYMTQERSEASYAATYFGGAKEDYDVIKHGGSQGIEATDGNVTAYRKLWQATLDGLQSNELYFRIQGMNPDGSRNPAYERLLDVENLADYMITAYFVGDQDGPGSRFTQPRPNNFYAIYNRTNPDGFKWFMHDSEHSLDTGTSDLVNPLTINHSGFNASNFFYFNPQWLHEKLASNAEYRRLFADRVYLHFFNQGALSINPSVARIDARSKMIEMAILGESARWGDSKREPAFTKADWTNAVNAQRNFVRSRHTAVIRQFQGRGWYPQIDPVSFAVDGIAQYGGQIEQGDQITFRSTTNGETIRIRANSRWSYLDNGAAPPANWSSSEFDSGDWKQGTGEFGYGDGGETTLLNFGNDPNNKFVTTYFRRTMTISDPGTVAAATVSLKRDDGAVVYVNGREVLRNNMPDGPIDHLTLATTTVGDAEENAYFDFAIDPSVLIAGTNTVAVEIHQGSRASSDVSFDLEFRTATLSPNTTPIYFTLDGSDPRLNNGEISPQARLWDGQGVSLNGSSWIAARAKVDNNWGVLSQARFSYEAAATIGALAISEIHYNPHPSVPQYGDKVTDDPDLFEFIEIQNVTQDPIDLTGVKLTEGVQFTFDNQVLGPGAYIVIPRDVSAFQSRYGTQVPLAKGTDGAGHTNVFDGRLSNNGERLQLEKNDGSLIQEVTYSDRSPWPRLADGDGSSLEKVTSLGDPNDPYRWRPSGLIGGSPGSAGGSIDRQVVVNEILTHTELPQIDAVELYNTTTAAVDISGWYLTDAGSELRRYRIPNGTILPAHGYLVIREDAFGFGFRGEASDNVYLVRAQASGKPVSFVDYAEFGATVTGTSLGRVPNGTGELFPMLETTFGETNAGPRLGSMLISEVQFRPKESPTIANINHLEFVEVTNTSATSVNIGNWQLASGVDYTFPSATQVAPGESVVLVSFDPTDSPVTQAFRSSYGLGNAIRLFGPFSDATRPNPDSLRDDGETIVLQRPEDSTRLGLGYVLVDRVPYRADGGWPNAAGNGNTLQRRGSSSFGDLPQSWFAELPTPGAVPTNELPGDVNGDRVIDRLDVNLLASAIQQGRTEAKFDLDRSGQVSPPDLDLLLTAMLQTRSGDLDLNGAVEFADFLTLAAHFGKSGQNWEQGNLTLDAAGNVEFADFLILASHFGYRRSSVAAAVDQVLGDL